MSKESIDAMLVTFDGLHAMGLTLSRSRIYQLISQGKFPMPLKLTPGGRNVAFRRDEVVAYINNLGRASIRKRA
jgi:predicted DNA-binding transcriptional regulator AlpA